jgi:hypothetical protein
MPVLTETKFSQSPFRNGSTSLPNRRIFYDRLEQENHGG